MGTRGSKLDKHTPKIQNHMTTDKFDVWAIIGLFGHQKLAGRVQEKNIGGAAFLQVDVPETDRQPAFTRIINPSAVYDINPVTEEVARQYAKNIQVAPIQAWDIKEFMNKVEQRKLEFGSTSVGEPEVEEEEEEID